MRELNLVPIIDMFTVLIFFMLLSTTFVALTKLTVPPSQVSTITDPVAPPPLAPKLLVLKSNDTIRLKLTWTGKEPGESVEQVATSQLDKEHTPLLKKAKSMSENFRKKYPEEKSIQLGLGRNVAYQSLVSVMDGIQEALPSVVLISYDEAEAKGGQEAGAK